MDNADFMSGFMTGEANSRGNNCNGWGNGGMWGMEWIFALLILPMMWGGGGFFGNRNGENAVTESALCNSMNFNNLENSVGRLSDQLNGVYTGLQNGLCTIGYQELQNTMGLQRDLCQGLTSVVASINDAAAQQARCCCETQRAIDGVNYNAAMNTAAINANTTAQTQKILDAICGNRLADLQNQVNALQLQNAVAGVVRYPTSTTFATNCNPFFGGWGCCNNGCNGNI